MSLVRYLLFLFFLALLVFLLSPNSAKRVSASSKITYAGVNLAGADFTETALPGTYNTDYTYPTHSEVDYFAGKGMNIIRLPFRWERLQQSQLSSFDSKEWARLDDIVTYATGKGISVLLDPHNYARYYTSSDNIIGGSSVPSSSYADFWSRLAARYRSNSRVIFGLMNEPHNMSTEQWRDDANAAIAAIRSTGATNLILVPGNGWTSAGAWYGNWYGTPNATVMLTITDPKNNYAFEVHQYLDIDASSTSPYCASRTIGSERLQSFTGWLKQNGKRGFLGEVGIGQNDTCYAALDDMLTYIDGNTDVWLGWTYWAAGPWWGDYIFSIEPANGVDKPQMATLAKHLSSPISSNPPVLRIYVPFTIR